MSWRTNRRTRKPFPTDDSDPYSNIDANEEMLSSAPSESSHELKEVGWTCSGCNTNYPSSAQQYELEGKTICVNCQKIVVSGVLDRETVYQDSPTSVASPSGPRDMGHTYNGACAGCGNTRRSLCPHCNRCYPCRAPSCPRKK